MKRVTAFSLISGTAIAALAWFNPPDMSIDPASTPQVRAEIAACVAAKPEIEAAARGLRGIYDPKGELEGRIEAVNAYDPRQCGQLLSEMRRARAKGEQMVTMGILAS